jgi:hypothetical protein
VSDQPPTLGRIPHLRESLYIGFQGRSSGAAVLFGTNTSILTSLLNSIAKCEFLRRYISN